MRAVGVVVLLGVVLAVAGLALPAAPASAQSRTIWFAQLSGGESVPMAASDTTGFAAFEVAADGNSLTYWLHVDNARDVQMAHIHIAPAGQNGPVAVWLYPSAPPARPIDGVFSGHLAEGTIARSQLIGPLAGQTLDALVSAISNGTAYVNVHTRAFPAGEIRGQIR